MRNIIFGFILGAFCYMSISSIANAEKPKETPYQDRALKVINESLKRIETKMDSNSKMLNNAIMYCRSHYCS